MIISKMASSVDPDEMAHYSSGATLFAYLYLCTELKGSFGDILFVFVVCVCVCVLLLFSFTIFLTQIDHLSNILC